MSDVLLLAYLVHHVCIMFSLFVYVNCFDGNNKLTNQVEVEDTIFNTRSPYLFTY